MGLGDAPIIPAHIPLRPTSMTTLYVPCCPFKIAPTNITIRANHPFYISVLDTNSERILIEALIEDPKSR